MLLFPASGGGLMVECILTVLMVEHIVHIINGGQEHAAGYIQACESRNTILWL